MKRKKIVDITFGSAKTAEGLVGQMENTGFQATNLFDAVELIKEMQADDATIFLTFTANMVASGMRGAISELIRKGFVDAVITTGGAIDHDIIRSHEPYFLGDFFMDDIDLHKKGINRIGNILVPTKRYITLERLMRRFFSGVYKEKKKNGAIPIFSPRELIEKMAVVASDDSIISTCRKKGVPIFCPGIIDSSIGLQVFFFKQEHSDFGIDVSGDMRELSDIVFEADKTGGIILGGGISKHYTIGANLLRNGMDYAVYITTTAPYDGSLSGAQTQEAKSWGKIKERGKTVTVYCDASIALPLIVSSLP